MKRVGVFLAVLVLLGGTCVDAQQSDTDHHTRDLKAIEELENTDALAAKANDVDALTSLWTGDGVLIQPMSPPVIGRSNIRAMLEQQKRRSATVDILSYDEDWKERAIRGDEAFEWGTISVTMKFANGREASQTVYVARLIVRAKDDSWHFARAIITPATPQGDKKDTEK
jgi:uncharacterized protein (TIGR02246 family)